MPDIILPGSAGRIEARYQRQKAPGAPMALVLHPHPQFGGTMNNPLVYDLFHMFHDLGCTTVRFNFRGVGAARARSIPAPASLSDAAAVLDWMNTLYPNPSNVWVCGISFGAWIGMQLLMRRPEITGFVSIAPPASMYDFAFLAPCPASGLIVHGTKDQVVPEARRAEAGRPADRAEGHQDHLQQDRRRQPFLRQARSRSRRDGERTMSTT